MNIYSSGRRRSEASVPSLGMPSVEPQSAVKTPLKQASFPPESQFGYEQPSSAGLAGLNIHSTVFIDSVYEDLFNFGE